MAKNWPHYASNRVAQPISVTNSIFLLAIVAQPIDRAHYLICINLLLMRTLFVGKGRQRSGMYF